MTLPLQTRRYKVALNSLTYSVYHAVAKNKLAWDYQKYIQVSQNIQYCLKSLCNNKMLIILLYSFDTQKLFTFSMMTFVDKCCFEIPHNALVHTLLSVVVITTLQRSKKCMECTGIRKEHIAKESIKFAFLAS